MKVNYRTPYFHKEEPQGGRIFSDRKHGLFHEDLKQTSSLLVWCYKNTSEIIVDKKITGPDCSVILNIAQMDLRLATVIRYVLHATWTVNIETDNFMGAQNKMHKLRMFGMTKTTWTMMDQKISKTFGAGIQIMSSHQLTWQFALLKALDSSHALAETYMPTDMPFSVY